MENNKSTLDAAALTGTSDLIPTDENQSEATYDKKNVDALAAFKTEYDERIKAEEEAANLDWQADPGYRMLEDRGSLNIQTHGIDTILYVNDKLVGDPHPDALKMTIPPKEARDSLIFHTHYVLRGSRPQLQLSSHPHIWLDYAKEGNGSRSDEARRDRHPDGQMPGHGAKDRDIHQACRC